MKDITTVILTYNEELNLEKCIESVKNISEKIVVVDSYSTDRTVKIAKNMGAEVIQNEFINHSKQFQFGIDNAVIETKWILKLDADERLTSHSAEEIERLCYENLNTEVNGIIVRFKVNFLGKNLKYGGIYPFKKLSIFKKGIGQIEQRNMDEHIVLSRGKTITLKNDSLHLDYKNLSIWIDKHNKYSNKEVMDYLENNFSKDSVKKLNINFKIKRILKYKLYYKLPLGIRPILYFLYRYFFKLGFLDGKEGFIFAVLQAFWYRFLIDSKIYENKRELKDNGK